jgi:hypothetical protein
MDRTAVIHFSGICAHIRKGSVEAPETPYQVMLPDVSDPAKYAQHPLLAGLPPHTARLIVKKENVRSPEAFTHEASLPVQGAIDAWSWRLDGFRLKVEVVPPVPCPLPVPCLKLSNPQGWITDVPSLHFHAPLADGGVREVDEAGLEARAAALLEIDDGELVPVNFDQRTGGSSVQWRLPVPEGGTISVKFIPLRGQRSLKIDLRVPDPRDTPPVEPLILIENVGTTKDDENDFLFHYYALFGFVPENARAPRRLGVVVGGAGVGCSNSSYP